VKHVLGGDAKCGPEVPAAYSPRNSGLRFAANARGPTVYTTFLATRAGIERHRAAFAAMTRAIRHMQGWLARHGAQDLAAATAPFYPDVEPDILTSSLQRYLQAGLWSRSPDWCWSSRVAIVPVSNKLDSRSTGPSKVSRRRRRSGPRNHAASGTANPCFGR